MWFTVFVTRNVFCSFVHAKFREEKGYGEDEIDLKIVDLRKSFIFHISPISFALSPHPQNLPPSSIQRKARTFRRPFCASTPKVCLSHPSRVPNFHSPFRRHSDHAQCAIKGTVPTMIVPFENTLDSVTESRYKAVTDITVRTARFRPKSPSYSILPKLSETTYSLAHPCFIFATGYRRPPRPFSNRHLPHPHHLLRSCALPLSRNHSSLRTL